MGFTSSSIHGQYFSLLLKKNGSWTYRNQKCIRHIVLPIHFILLITYVQSIAVVHLKNISKKSTLKKKSELKKENVSRILASFLGIDLKIKEKETSTKLFDKRDSFSFEIVRIPFFNINRTSKIFYSFIGSNMVFLARNTSDRLTFIMQVNTLLDIMSK